MMRNFSSGSKRRRARLATAACVCCLTNIVVLPVARAQSIDLSRFTMIDLSHELAADAPAWPGSGAAFKLDTLTATPTAALFRLTTNEHFGTHLDAPRHASGEGWTNERVPLASLIAPLVVIDISAQALKDRDYALTPSDIEAYERSFGRLPRGTTVVLRTGWGALWNDPSKYFGADTTVRPRVLHFPSFGVEAAKLLVARGVVLLGVDSPSTDIGAAQGFPVHRILGAANVPAIENLAALNDIPRSGATIIALPLKTRGGSGGPVRVVVLVPKGAAR